MQECHAEMSSISEIDLDNDVGDIETSINIAFDISYHEKSTTN